MIISYKISTDLYTINMLSCKGGCDMKFFHNYKTIVVKVGASFICDLKHGVIRNEWLRSFVEDVMFLLKAGHRVVIVSSGAITLGAYKLGLSDLKLKLIEKQAISSFGQVELMRIYTDAFKLHNQKVSQILLSIENTEDRRVFANSREMINYLLDMGIVPIINQNDFTNDAEIRFGDKDRLAAKISKIVKADLLVLLSKVNGLYEKDPTLFKGAHFMDELSEVTKDVEAMAQDSVAKTGGMSAKICATKMALQAGSKVVIANGVETNPLSKISSSPQTCTKFLRV